MSYYSLITVSDHSRTIAHIECTVIGVVVFNKDGVYCGHKIANLDRAKHRGDWPESDDGKWLDEHVKSLTKHKLEKMMDTVAHAMGSLHFRSLCGSLLEPADLLVDTFRLLVREDTTPNAGITYAGSPSSV